MRRQGRAEMEGEYKGPNFSQSACCRPIDIRDLFFLFFAIFCFLLNFIFVNEGLFIITRLTKKIGL